MCNFCFTAPEPKDETWKEDMDRDAQLYMAELAAEERESEEDDE